MVLLALHSNLGRISCKILVKPSICDTWKLTDLLD